MTKRTDFGVFIGRFQPYHKGHQAIVNDALKQVNNLIIVLGSVESPRTSANPFTAHEREEMIRLAHPGAALSFISLPDYHNTEVWLTALQHKVNELIEDAAPEAGYPVRPRITLFGFKKDKSSDYLTEIELGGPFFGSHELSGVRRPQDATDIRKAYFEQGVGGTIAKKDGKSFPLENDVPSSVYAFLSTFAETKEYTELAAAYLRLEEYKAKTQAPHLHYFDYQRVRVGKERVSSSDLELIMADYLKITEHYPVQFVTVDAVTLHRGHVLVIKRSDEFGRNQLALPGGFVMAGETIIEATVRELKEETSIQRNRDLLRSDIAGRPVVFDAPKRSLRGRTFTHVSLIKIPSNVPPVPVKGGDDASGGTHWMSLAEIQKRRSEFFEDHIHIIETMVAGAGIFS